jgi:hypothetical protein
MQNMTDFKRICDRCDNFEVSQDGMTETCHAQREGSVMLPVMDAYYISERVEGNKANCKRFKKIQNTNHA